MQETTTHGSRPVLQAELEFRSKLDEFRPRLIQWAREVEKPLGEVGDLRSAYVHLRHVLNVANLASVFEEIVLYVEYQGARRSLHIPVANRIKSHLREIQKVAENDERLALVLAQNYAGYVTRIAKIAQTQRGNRPLAKVKATQGQPQQQQPREGQPRKQQGPGGGKGRGRGRGDRPEGRGGQGQGQAQAQPGQAAEAKPEAPKAPEPGAEPVAAAPSDARDERVAEQVSESGGATPENKEE